MIDLSKFSERLKKERKSKELTKMQLAKRTGIDYHSISNYEKDMQKPSLFNLIVLADFFNVPVGYLLGGNYYD